MGRKMVMTGKGINFRLTDAERKLLDEAAGKDGMTTPQWVKQVALREARAPERWREFAVALRMAEVGEDVIGKVLEALEKQG